MYDYCRAPDSEPVLVTTKVMMQTSRQLQHRLMCSSCEHSLNIGGEEWLLPLLATIDKTFPLLDLIETLPPEAVDGDDRIYAASRNPAIHVDRLLHFVMGVFWKASIHSWSGNSKEPLIELGPYGEKVRTFLRGETPFPKNMGLVIGVLPREKAVVSFSYPYRGLAKDCHNFIFYIPGVQVALNAGKRLPTGMPTFCFASHPLHPILVADLSSDVKSVFRGVIAKAHKSRRLVKYLRSHTM